MQALQPSPVVAGITHALGCWRYPMNTTNGLCKTIYGRMGRLSWENYLGRLEHGGWESFMTCILEIWTIE